MIIYKATNKINGMSYIGQTTRTLDKRKKEHIHEVLNNKNECYFHNAIRKYGSDNFDWDVIEGCDNIDELNKLEAYYIGWYNTYDNGYNLTMGGEGISGFHHSKEAKQKMRKLKSKEHKQSLSEARKGKKLSEYHKQKISESAPKGKNNHRAKLIILIHPNGVEEQFDCMINACRKYNLSHGNLSTVAQGKRKHHKSFKCRYINKEI